MHCSECRDLYRAFERTATRYREALSSAFVQVSTSIVVRREVDMQRAASDLQEHQDDCPWAMAAKDLAPVVN